MGARWSGLRPEGLQLRPSLLHVFYWYFVTFENILIVFQNVFNNRALSNIGGPHAQPIN